MNQFCEIKSNFKWIMLINVATWKLVHIFLIYFFYDKICFDSLFLTKLFYPNNSLFNESLL